MKQLCDISIVLDRSGSMASVRDGTIEAFNAFLKKQAEDPYPTTVSPHQFDDVYETVYAGRPAKEAPELTRLTFEPRGSTALLDAIGRTIDQTGQRLASLPESDRPDKVLVVILTDGQENASREYTKQAVLDRIRHQEDKYAWTFVFLGAGIDAIATAASFGIGANNALRYANDPAGWRQGFDALAVGTSNLKCRAAGGSYKSFVSDAQKDADAGQNDPQLAVSSSGN